MVKLNAPIQGSDERAIQAKCAVPQDDLVKIQTESFQQDLEAIPNLYADIPFNPPKQDEEKEGIQNSMRNSRTPHPGEIDFNTMRCRKSKSAQRLGYFQSSIKCYKITSKRMKMYVKIKY